MFWSSETKEICVTSDWILMIFFYIAPPHPSGRKGYGSKKCFQSQITQLVFEMCCLSMGYHAICFQQRKNVENILYCGPLPI